MSLKRKHEKSEPDYPQKCMKNKAEIFISLADELNGRLNQLKWLKRIGYVYNPTEYARKCYELYVRKYCNHAKKILFLGMNPGPWGMSQTGVPFGEVTVVRDWLKIEEEVGKPNTEHPARPVLGFVCTRSEVSGQRIWGLIKQLSGKPEIFHENSFIYNYLPLQFIDKSGKNIPPTALKKEEQVEIFDVCDDILKEVIQIYEVETVVGVGKFAEQRANAAINKSENTSSVKVVSILHPSPRSKAANNWHQDTINHLTDLGLIHYLKPRKKPIDNIQ